MATATRGRSWNEITKSERENRYQVDPPLFLVNPGGDLLIDIVEEGHGFGGAVKTRFCGEDSLGE